MITASFANSLGWTESGPMISQRVAPFRSTPTPGINTKINPKNAMTSIGTLERPQPVVVHSHEDHECATPISENTACRATK